MITRNLIISQNKLLSKIITISPLYIAYIYKIKNPHSQTWAVLCLLQELGGLYQA